MSQHTIRLTLAAWVAASLLSVPLPAQVAAASGELTAGEAYVLAVIDGHGTPLQFVHVGRLPGPDGTLEVLQLPDLQGTGLSYALVTPTSAVLGAAAGGYLMPAPHGTPTGLDGRPEVRPGPSARPEGPHGAQQRPMRPLVPTQRPKHIDGGPPGDGAGLLGGTGERAGGLDSSPGGLMAASVGAGGAPGGGLTQPGGTLGGDTTLPGAGALPRRDLDGSRPGERTRTRTPPPPQERRPIRWIPFVDPLLPAAGAGATAGSGAITLLVSEQGLSLVGTSG